MKKLQFVAYAIAILSTSSCSSKDEPTSDTPKTVVVTSIEEIPEPVVLEDKLDSLAFEVVETLQQNRDSLQKVALPLHQYESRGYGKLPVRMAEFSSYERKDGQYKFYPMFFTDYGDGSLDGGTSHECIVTLAAKDSVITNTFWNDEGEMSGTRKYSVKKGDFLVFREGRLVVDTDSFTNAKKELLEELQNTSNGNTGAYGGVYPYGKE